MWPIIKKAVNSDLSTPLNTLINNVKSIVNTVNSTVNTVNSTVNTVNSTVNTVNTNVGSNADPASSTGSLHAKIKSLDSNGVMLRQSIASGSLRFASDFEVSYGGVEWVKKKTIAVMFSGMIRVSFDLRGSSTSYQGYGRIYRNGVPIGTERIVNGGASYITFAEDIPCSPGCTIELWLRSLSGGTAFARNFRIYFDINTTPIYGMVL